MSKTQPARGMRDFLPSDIRKRNYVINIIKEVYESYGFEPLETPAVENIETLMGKYGEEGNQLIFKILKRGEKLDLANGEKGLSDLALRYDLTVPTARVVANYKSELPKFFKRYQIQPVWRADRPARGRYREFYQCDVDAIGSKSMIVEAELISAVCEILERLGFEDFQVRLNDREVLTAILNNSKIDDRLHSDALVAIDKLDKIGVEGVSKEFAERGITTESGDRLLQWLGAENSDSTTTLSQSNENLLQKFSTETSETELAERVKSILGSLTESVQNRVLVDFSLARGLSYYTGAIFEIVLTNGDFKGSIGGGGRYDGLIGMFGKEEIPACGFSLGLERILVVMDERGMFPADVVANSADVMVTIWNEEAALESLKLARELRKAGLRVLVYPEADKLGKQFKYAGQVNVPFVCVLGETELSAEQVTIKNMFTGEQETVGRNADFRALMGTVRN